MRYTLENNYLKVIISTLGATLVSLIEKSTNTDIILGFDTDEEYIINKATYAGSTVARNANRIKNAEFSLNGKLYKLLKNDNVNNLHGGNGTSFSEFNLLNKTSNSLTFCIDLLDGQDGFPGNMNLEVIYEILDNTLRITYKGKSDKDTIFNVTNHSYFNLNGNENNILNHEAMIYTDKFALNDKNGLSLDLTKDVKDTMFDFTCFKSYKDNLNISDDNNSNGGIDHNYVYEILEPKKLITLRNESLKLTMYSDYPDMHMYTANYFDKVKGRNGLVYNKFHGVALEPQFYPNSINYDKYLKPIIKENEETTHFIEYVIEKR